MKNNDQHQTTIRESALPTGWRDTGLRLHILVSKTGMVSFYADEPRNLMSIGTSLQDAFNGFVSFAKECAELGKPFAALEGIKLEITDGH